LKAALLPLIEIRTRRERHAAQYLSKFRRAQRMESLLRGDRRIRVLEAILNGDQSVRIGADVAVSAHFCNPAVVWAAACV